MARYVPERGDLVWLKLDRQTGREQAGRRPALVLSPRGYNHKVGLAICCPVTAKVKRYPFEVLVPDGLEISGAVLSDHVESLDWRARSVRLITRAPESLTAEVLGKLGTLLGPA